MRAGDVELAKVLRVEKPTDVLTKFTERATLAKMLSKLNLLVEDGRAESAPSIAAMCYFVKFDKHPQRKKGQ